MDRGLDQRARDDGAGDRAGIGVVGGPGHLAGEQRRRALAVGGLLAGEVAGDGLDRRGERRRAPASSPASAAPAAPEARTNTVSLVLVSPSTESWSQVRAAAAAAGAWSVAGSAVASVRTIDSIVAIRGWIIPTPFAMPVTVIWTVPPPVAGAADGRRRDLRRGVGGAQRLGAASSERLVVSR